MIEEVIFTPEVRRRAEILLRQRLVADRLLRNPIPNAKVEGAESLAGKTMLFCGKHGQYEVVLYPTCSSPVTPEEYTADVHLFWKELKRETADVWF